MLAKSAICLLGLAGSVSAGYSYCAWEVVVDGDSVTRAVPGEDYCMTSSSPGSRHEWVPATCPDYGMGQLESFNTVDGNWTADCSGLHFDAVSSSRRSTQLWSCDCGQPTPAPPTAAPSAEPTAAPSAEPTAAPSAEPTEAATTDSPSASPTEAATTGSPSWSPTQGFFTESPTEGGATTCQGLDGVTYSDGQEGLDTCGNHCTCDNGSWSNCCRRRQEFTSMTDAERKLFIDTYKQARTDPAVQNIITSHAGLFSGNNIHLDSQFLPWHRWYILQMENALQAIDCRVTMPHWDWELTPDTSTSAVWGSADHWLGESDTTTSSKCVSNGPFSTAAGFTKTDGDCLTRDHRAGTTTASAVEVDTLIYQDHPAHTDFPGFRDDLERGGGLHGSVHCTIHGDMCSSDAAEDPVFFLHHAHLDEIWDEWQKQSTQHRDAYDGNLNTAMPTGSIPAALAATPAQVLDLSNQPGGVCVTYQISEFGMTLRQAEVKALAMDPSFSLASIPREEITSMAENTEWLRLSGMTDEEIALVPVISENDKIASAPIVVDGDGVEEPEVPFLDVVTGMGVFGFIRDQLGEDVASSLTSQISSATTKLVA